MDNDNDQTKNVWALIKPKTIGWSQGRVEVSSNADKEYQVRKLINNSVDIRRVVKFKHLFLDKIV